MRYRHLRRTTIALAGIVAVIVVLGALLVAGIQSAPARRLTRRWLELRAGASLDAEVRISELAWGMLPPRLLLEDVAVSGRGLEVTVEDLTIHLDSLNLLQPSLELGSVAAQGVRIHLQELPHPTSDRSPLTVTLHQLDLRDVELVGTGLVRSLEKISLHGVTLDYSQDVRGSVGVLRVDQALLDIRGIEQIELGVAARFIHDRGLVLPRWKVFGPGITLGGEGELSPAGRLQLDAAGTVQLGELDRVVRAGGILEGNLSVKARLDSVEDELLVFDVASPRVVAAGFEVRHLDGQLRLTGDRLTGTVRHGVFHHGSFQGEYTLTPLHTPFAHEVQATATSVDLAGVLTNLGVPPAGMSATADLQTSIRWSGKNIAAGRGEGFALLRPGDGRLGVDGQLEVRLTPEGLLRFWAEDLGIGGSRVDWQGPLTIGEWEPSWSLRANPATLRELLPMVNAYLGATVLPETVDGAGELQVTLSGEWQHLQVGLRLETEQLSYPPLLFDRVFAEGTIAGDQLRVTTARYTLGAGSGQLEGVLSWRQETATDPIDLMLRGQAIPVAALATWAGVRTPMEGSVAFTGPLRGTFEAPHGSWAVAMSDLQIAGAHLGNGAATLDLAEGTFFARGLDFDQGLQGSLWWSVPTGEVGVDLTWPAMPLEPLTPSLAALLGSHASLELELVQQGPGIVLGQGSLEGSTGMLRAQSSGATISVSGKVDEEASLELELVRDDAGTMTGRGAAQLTDAQALLTRLLQRPSPLGGKARLDLELSWPAHGAPVITGRMSTFDLTFDDKEMTLNSGAGFVVGDNGLTLDDLRLGLLGEELMVKGLRVSPDGSLRAQLGGGVDARLLRAFVPEWEPAGRISGALELGGTLEHPWLHGTTSVSAGSFRLPGSRQIAADITGPVLFARDEVQLEDVTYRLLGGSGSASGQLLYGGDELSLGLHGSIQDASYQVLPGLAPIVHGRWRLEGPVSNLVLAGDLVIDQATLTRRDDPTTILIDWLGQLERPAGYSGLGLDLHVVAENTIEARSPFLSLTGSAELAVTGSTDRLGLVGKVELNEGGDLTFQNVRYEVERATLTFSDPSQFDPQIDIQARAWVQNYQVTVRLNGTTQRLVPVLSSDPPLEESEIFSLLALGFPDKEMGSGAMGVGLASTILTRQINAEIERRARMILPVDQVRVDPFAEQATGNPAARVTVVKQLSPTWTIILQSNLSSNREEVVISRWFLGPGVFVEATRDVDGSYGMDLKLRRRY